MMILFVISHIPKII